MTDCTEYEVLLSTRLDGELTPDEDARLTAHLAVCPSCRALAAELDSLHLALEAIAPIPPASLAEAVMEQVEAEAKPIPFPARNGTEKRWKRYGAFAALLTLVILGGSIFAVSPFSPFHAAGSAPDMETAAVTEEALSAEAAMDSPEEAVPAEAEDLAKAVPAEAAVLAEAVPAKGKAAASTAGEVGRGASSGGVSHPYSYTAEPAPPQATEPAAADRSAVCAETEEAAPESAFETQSCQSPNPCSPAPLSETQAKSCLQAELNAGGNRWTVTGNGQSADGTAWLFTAVDSDSALTHRFSVSLSTGQVTELPPPD